MKVIDELESMGYVFAFASDKISYTFQGDELDYQAARELLSVLRDKRDEAVAYLSKRSMELNKLPEMVALEDYPDVMKRFDLEIQRIDWPKGKTPVVIVQRRR